MAVLLSVSFGAHNRTAIVINAHHCGSTDGTNLHPISLATDKIHSIAVHYLACSLFCMMLSILGSPSYWSP